MDLENVKKGLMKEAKAEAKTIIENAEKGSASAIASANEKAKSMVAAARQRASEMVEAERNERFSAAKLKAKKILSDARNRVVDGASQQVWVEFVKVRETPSYEKMLKGLVGAAEKELGEKSTVCVNENDMKLAKKFSKNLSQKPAGISGGAVVVSKDGRVSIDNSFEAIFDSRKDDVKKIIFRELRGNGDGR